MRNHQSGAAALKQQDQQTSLEDTLPGFKRSDWPSLSRAPEAVIPLCTWEQLSTSEKIQHEQQAIAEYFSRKNPDYVHAIVSRVDELPAMSATQRITLVVPAYNEHASIGEALKALLGQTPSHGGAADPSLWGALIVVNRPVVSDAERNAIDSDNMAKTISQIEAFKSAHPELDIHYVKAEIPAPIAGVGMARMIGHDVCAMRSLKRPSDQRVAPWFIQTFDADNSKLHPEYLPRLLSQIEADNFSKDFYREAPRFPLEDLRSCPLLHASDILWTETLRGIAWNGGSPWTAGAGILVSGYAHFSAGGVFPFKYDVGVDEDLRIGIHAKALRGAEGLNALGDFKLPLFETDPRRNLLAIGDLLATIQQEGVTEPLQPFSQNLADIATLLSSYRNFHETAIRGKNYPKHPDTSWLDSPESFREAVPAVALQILANSYLDLIRIDLSVHLFVEKFEWAKEVYSKFARGDFAYSTMRGLCQAEALSRLHGASEDQAEAKEIREIFCDAAATASSVMSEILQSYGIDAVKMEVDPLPPAEGSPFPIMLHITSTDRYREYLRLLLNPEAPKWL